MLNRILYWFITLPVVRKLVIMLALGLIGACSCSILATIPAAQARQATQATQTAATAATSVAGAHTAATAAAIAQVTAGAQRDSLATASAVAQSTAEVQFRLDATTTAVAQVTVQAEANARATIAGVTQVAASTATALANATASVLAKQEATKAAVVSKTAAALAAVQQRAANSTATRQAQDVSAQATAVWRKYLGYQTKAPEGNFQAAGATAGIACNLTYRDCISYSCANKDSKFIVVNIAVQATGRATISVNPIDFTLVSTSRRAVTLDASTFSLSSYLDAITIDPGTHTSGQIAFLTTKDFIPGQLVWRSFLSEMVSVPIIESP